MGIYIVRPRGVEGGDTEKIICSCQKNRVFNFDVPIIHSENNIIGTIMSDHVMFDTLAYAKKLKSAGFTEDQAEIQAEALASIIDEKLATKQDLKELELRMLVRLGAIQAAGIAIVAALVKLL